MINISRSFELFRSELKSEAGLLSSYFGKLGNDVAETEELDDGLDLDAYRVVSPRRMITCFLRQGP